MAMQGASAGMAAVRQALQAGLFKREYRDHRLEWMIRNGAFDVVQTRPRARATSASPSRSAADTRGRAMLDVLYRSHDLLAINKPSGISLLGDRSGAPCLWDTLRERTRRAKAASPSRSIASTKAPAVCCWSRFTRERQAQLTKAFAERAVRKFYVARVLGDVRSRAFERHHRPAARPKVARAAIAWPRRASASRGTDRAGT